MIKWTSEFLPWPRVIKDRILIAARRRRSSIRPSNLLERFSKKFTTYFTSLSFFLSPFDFLRKIFLEHVYNRDADYPNVNTVKRNKDQKEKRMGRAKREKIRNEETKERRSNAFFNEARSFFIIRADCLWNARIGAIDFDEARREEKERKEKKVFLTKSIVKRSWNERALFFFFFKKTQSASGRDRACIDENMILHNNTINNDSADVSRRRRWVLRGP